MAKVTPVALAIVIPAFRVRHLAEALASLVSQTDPNFRVYVGDDASPEPLKQIVDRFIDRLDLKYERFDSNLGGNDLVAHWRRCISLTQREPWLWLFADDDVMEPECVACFYESIRDGGPLTDVYRFQMDFINDHSVRYFRPSAHPPYEDVDELLKGLLIDRHRAWRAQDHIFSRHAYERCGGIVDFPKAIYSDHATWLRFADPNGVRTISGPRVLWRNHPSGTSSGMREAHRENWQTAIRLYVKWLADFAHDRGGASEELFRKKGANFFFRQVCIFRPKLNSSERKVAIRFVQVLFGLSSLVAYGHFYFTLVWHRIAQSSLTRPVRKWRMKSRLRNL